MPTKTSKSAKFKDTMQSEYDMTGGVRGRYARGPKVDEQVDNEIFAQVGFDQSLRGAFDRICAFIASADGCNAGIYKPPRMGHVRVAHVLPGEGGRKKAKQFFLMVAPRRHKILLLRRKPFRIGKPEEEGRIEVGKDFSDWIRLEAKLKEWSQDWKEPTKPKAAIEWGDGHALPGGLPETNRAKF
jgi:hypothetical protein